MSTNIGPLVSVLIPVRNGSGRLEHCLDSLTRQDLPSTMFEVIVADGRSTDNSAQIAKAYGCLVVDNPKVCAAGGRNSAWAAARGKFIAVTEDDIVLPPGWLSAGIRALENDAVGAVGGPTPIPRDSPPFARAVDMVFRAAAGIGYSVQSGLSGPAKLVRDIPGGNAMYRREVFEDAMPEDERLIAGEEVDLHIRMQNRGNKLAFSPDFLAWHHKRDAPGRFFTQILRFARGRVQVNRLHKGTMRSMHWGAALLPPVTVLLLLLLPLGVALGILAAGAVAAIIAGLASGLGLRASFWLPVAAGLFFLAWPMGVFQELFATSIKHPPNDSGQLR